MSGEMICVAPLLSKEQRTLVWFGGHDVPRKSKLEFYSSCRYHSFRAGRVFWEVLSVCVRHLERFIE
jgi:hypothetical protein